MTDVNDVIKALQNNGKQFQKKIKKDLNENAHLWQGPELFDQKWQEGRKSVGEERTWEEKKEHSNAQVKWS